jgi:hypothetical protein
LSEKDEYFFSEDLGVFRVPALEGCFLLLDAWDFLRVSRDADESFESPLVTEYADSVSLSSAMYARSRLVSLDLKPEREVIGLE